MTNLQLAIQFFFQIAVILTLCQIVGRMGTICWSTAGRGGNDCRGAAGAVAVRALLSQLSLKLFPKASMQVLFPVSQARAGGLHVRGGIGI